MPLKRMMKTVIQNEGMKRKFRVWGRGEGGKEGLNSALVHKLFSQHPYLYNSRNTWLLQ